MAGMTKLAKMLISNQQSILGASNGIGQKTFDKLIASANQLGRKASLEDVTTHAGLKKKPTQWLLDNYGGSAKSKSPLTLSNGYSPTEQAQINAQKAARQAELKQKYGSVAEYKAQKAEAARRSAAEAKIAQQNPGGLRVNNSSSLDEFDKAHSVSDAEMRKRRIEIAAHKIVDKGKFGSFGGLETRGARTAEDRATNALEQRTTPAKNGVDDASSIEKSINRHARTQQSLANQIEDARQVEHSGDSSNRLQQAEMREQQRQLKERLQQRAGSSTKASSGFRKANEAWDAADVADKAESTSYGGLGLSDEQIAAFDNADKKWEEAQAGNHKVETAKEKLNREMEEEYQRGIADGSINPSAYSEGKTSTPQSGGAETHTQSGGGSTGAKSGGEGPSGELSGGDSLQAKMLARMGKASGNDQKHMFERLAGRAGEFDADMKNVKNGDFKGVADQYGLNATDEAGLRKQFGEQLESEAGQGPTTMDWIMGNHVPHKMVGGAAIAGAMSSIFGGGQRSNADLYSNPFQ